LAELKKAEAELAKFREALILLLHHLPLRGEPVTAKEVAIKRARDALAGGSDQESCRTLSDELRNKIEKTMTDHWDMKACECLVCEAGRVLGCGPREWHQPHKQKHYVTKNPCDCYPSPENWGVCRDCGKDILDSGTET